MNCIDWTLDDLSDIAATVRGMVERHMEAVKKEIQAQALKTREMDEGALRDEAGMLASTVGEEDKDKDKGEKKDMDTSKSQSQSHSQNSEQDQGGKQNKKDLLAELIKAVGSSPEDDADVVEAKRISPDLRKELIARIRQRLVEETPRITMMQQQLQETRDILAAFQQRTEKVRADIRFIQLMAREAHERMEKIEAARKKRAALEQDKAKDSA